MLSKHYRAEFAFMGLVLIVSIAGFWNLLFANFMDATMWHFLHGFTAFSWIFLIITQLMLVELRKPAIHRKLGQAIYIIGSFLIAGVYTLAVHSASKAAAGGGADPMLLQNVGASIELSIIIMLAFFLKNNRVVHGNLLLASSMLFLVVGAIFALTDHVLEFQITGPETFVNFGRAGAVAQWTATAIGILMFLRRRRGGWPWLLGVLCLWINGWIGSFLTSQDRIDATAAIGSLDEAWTFGVTFLSAMLLFAVALKRGQSGRP